MTPSTAALLSRLAASLLGGYVFVWGLVTVGIVVGVAAGLSYADAQMLVYLLAFLVFLAVFCWAYAARRLMHVYAVLLGGGAAMTAAAWFLAASLIRA